MPSYDFKCLGCRHVFEETMSMSSYQVPTKCPKCSGDKTVVRIFTDPVSNVIRGDHQVTIGELAERNSERFSKDKKIALHKKHHEYRDNPPEIQPRYIK